MKSIKYRLGPLFPIIVASLIIILVFSISRLGLLLWHAQRVSLSDGWLYILANGLRIDIVSVCILFIIPALVSCIISGEHKLGKIWQLLLRIWITFGLWFAVYMEVVTPTFISEYDLRPNRLFIEYLIYPKEVFSMLWSGYKIDLVLVALISTITIVLGWKLTEKLSRNHSQPKWFFRPVILIIVLIIGTMGARSTLGHRPINPAMVAFSTDPLMNDLVLNSAYSLLFAAKQLSAEENTAHYYPSMSEQEIITQIKDSMNVDVKDFIPSKGPTFAKHASMNKGANKNIVILLLESHGARYVKSLGGADLSPNLDKLYKEGWAFDRMYATGTRSVRGIEALTTGFLPTPNRSVVKLSKSQTGFFSIAHLLKSKNYHTQFIYGGESHFDNMKSFFLGNGFSDMQDFNTFKHPKFVGSWGASDEDLYEKADRQFSLLKQQSKSFFSLVFSSSNHSPYEYPENTITLHNQPKKSVENAVKYADYALGKFIEKAKKSTYWNDTIFVVIADHDSRSYGSSPVPIGHFKIPAVIFGGGVSAKRDSRLVSQIDIAPTLLSLAGIDSVNPMIGHDLTREIPLNKQRAIMQRGKNFAWMSHDNKVVIAQPEKPLTTYNYNIATDTLEAFLVDTNIVKRALATGLWGSLAYQKGYYNSLKTYD